MEKKELRILSNEHAIVRSEDESSRTIEGRALMFDVDSEDLGGFTESIDPTALDGVLENQDVLALYNHDENRGVLARFTNGEGTLELEVDETGLTYKFESPNTGIGVNHQIQESVMKYLKVLSVVISVPVHLHLQ